MDHKIKKKREKAKSKRECKAVEKHLHNEKDSSYSEEQRRKNELVRERFCEKLLRLGMI